MFIPSRVLGLIGLFLSSVILCLCASRGVTAPSANSAHLVQEGVDLYRAGDYKSAVVRWKTALEAEQPNPANTAIIRENLARAHQQLGQSDAAIAQWDQVVAYYRQTQNLSLLGRSLTEQAQVYSSLGQSRKAIALLCGQETNRLKTMETLTCLPTGALQMAWEAKDLTGEAAALGSLGDAYRLRGDYQTAIVLLQSSLDRAEANPAYRMAALNSLGNAYSSRAQVSYRRAASATQRGDVKAAEHFQQLGRTDDEQALGFLRKSENLARDQTDGSGELHALINAIPVYYRVGDHASAAATLQHATALLGQLPDKRDFVYAAIDLARLQQPVAIGQSLSRTDCLRSDQLAQAESLLQRAVTSAQHLQDPRAESFALGALGQLYICRDNGVQALHLTQQALLTADQDLKAKDSLFLWEWQMGRILKAQGRKLEAIAAYERAIATLETIRGDILSANRDLQFDFRDTIEPIYRDLVSLKLEQETPVSSQTKANDKPKPNENFKGILGTIDSLQLAELQNYFGNDCVVVAVNSNRSDVRGDSSTAVINTIILEDRTAIILSLPGGQKHFAVYNIKRQDLIREINAFREGLATHGEIEGYDSQPAQRVYNWLIRPFAEKGYLAQIKTLVFVQDGILRSIPMATLHDGKQFLIQQYAIATTPSLSLTDTKSFDRSGLRVLALGLTKEAIVDNQPFPAIRFRALANVRQELDEVADQMPGSKKLLDEAFTSLGMQTELSQTVYPILHLATHGQFGTDPDDTFIVTGKNQKLTLSELDRVIRQNTRNREPLELLTLTACETAVGDDRSSLGLAGVAIQAGARSALASLWSVNDAATAQLARDFYANLGDVNLTKAEALQRAQKAWIEQSADNPRLSHPVYWSAFMLIGNWQ